MSQLFLPFLLLSLGLILLVAENMLPTSGALGIVAAGCLLLLLYQGFAISPGTGLAYLATEILLVPVAYGASSYLLTKTGFGRIITLRPPEADEVAITREGPDLDRLVGRRGKAVTTLRPSGMVDFEGRRLDGIAAEGLIPPGAPVMAVQVRSGRLIVRVIPGDSGAEPA